MWQLNKHKRNKENNSKHDELARKIAGKIIRVRKSVVGWLERWDNRMTQTQRKVIFYVSIFIWCGCMLYFLGDALRKPPEHFMSPLYDSVEIERQRQFDSLLNAHRKIIIHPQHKKANNGKNGTK